MSTAIIKKLTKTTFGKSFAYCLRATKTTKKSLFVVFSSIYIKVEITTFYIFFFLTAALGEVVDDDLDGVFGSRDVREELCDAAVPRANLGHRLGLHVLNEA